MFRVITRLHHHSRLQTHQFVEPEFGAVAMIRPCACPLVFMSMTGNILLSARFEAMQTSQTGLIIPALSLFAVGLGKDRLSKVV